jgi:hypothetical protein
MKIFRLHHLLLVVILVGGLGLRFWGLENRAPFDWDQNRDYQVVTKLARGEITLIGPVAKGELGFFLGPLYYYLLLPGYLIADGSLLALPVAAVICDVMAILAMLTFLPARWGRGQSLLMAAVWSVSWFAIESARISWNVALVPLWTILTLAFLTKPPTTTKWGVVGLGVLLGLAWHVHAALIPLGLLLSLPFLFSSCRVSTWGFFAFGYLLPLLPLVLFDLRHGGLEHRLLLNFLQTTKEVRGDWSLIIPAVMSRLGKNVSAFLGGAHDLNLLLGYGMGAFALFTIFRGTTFARWATAAILVNLTLALLLRDPGLPEYYLLVSTIGSLIILVDFIFHFRFPGLFVVPLFTLFLVQNIRLYSHTETSFSLGVKDRLVQDLTAFPTPISVEYDLPFGREAGINILMTRAGLSGEGAVQTEAIITEKADPTLFIKGEVAEDRGWFGALRLGVRRVQ